MTTAPDDQDRQFLGRVHAAITTVEAWDADPSVLAECRAQIPLQDIANHTREDDVLYRGNALFLKQLTLYFKEKVMTWVNNPPCAKCGNTETTCRTSRGPITLEEKEGGASRVEVYYCPTCQDTTTTFPRYSSVRKLLETRKGRCGEFANLFGLYCRAVGFEVRYCADFTDHVWVECCLVDGDNNDEWIMADACEGLIDKNSMYESGWNKQLSYIVGVTVDSVVDVTPRYTRKWFSPDFHAQRRAICSSQTKSQQILKQLNDTLKQKCTKSRRDELDRRYEKEQKMLSMYQQATEWTEKEKHGQGQGRISGSLQWKLSRKEAGTLTEKEETSFSLVQTWHVESFYPPSTNNNGGGGVTIRITSNKGIIVSGTECSVVGSSPAISVVVVDEAYLGCILQSRGFHSWRDVSDFVETLPKHRIVAIQGKGQKQEKEDGAMKGLLRLGGLVVPTGDDGLLYLGQVGAKPSWARCAAYADSEGESLGIHVFLPRVVEPKACALLRLRTERDTVPRRVAWRLPESVMPLETQLLATEEQKRTAFLRFAQNGESHCKRYVGYTTKPNAPVYLLHGSAYPFAQTKGGWNTFHYLPDPLVPKDDVGIVVSTECGTFTTVLTETLPHFYSLFVSSLVKGKNKTGVPKVDIPLDSSFFTGLFGPSLLVNTNGASAVLVDTPNALYNTRLVGLYFSAHWCPPCRRFTPMLAELYSHLKEEFSTHGLEMVFVSSDRDESGFQQYFVSMPWIAVPFQSGGMIIPRIKAR
jgi:peptide-N4-(N-acetyl-beta-glucosaminyl)asparagine amidase